MQVAEMFPTIQGEGYLTGEPSFFVRFQGCSFGCVSCDTKFSWPKGDREITPFDLASKVFNEKGGCTGLVITGGEPFEQDCADLREFIETCRKFFRNITIETAAFVPIKKLPQLDSIISMIDILSISPKLGTFWRDQANVDTKNYIKTVDDYVETLRGIYPAAKLGLKYVITELREIDEVVDMVLSHTENGLRNAIVTLQPNGYDSFGNPEEPETLIVKTRVLIEALVMEKSSLWRLASLGLDIRILPQLHRMLWGMKKGV